MSTPPPPQQASMGVAIAVPEKETMVEELREREANVQPQNLPDEVSECIA